MNYRYLKLPNVRRVRGMIRTLGGWVCARYSNGITLPYIKFISYFILISSEPTIISVGVEYSRLKGSSGC